MQKTFLITKDGTIKEGIEPVDNDENQQISVHDNIPGWWYSLKYQPPLLPVSCLKVYAFINLMVLTIYISVC